MIDKASSLLLCRLIGIGYAPTFLGAPEPTANAMLPTGFSLVGIIWGTDFKGLFGQERVPYGTLSQGPDGQTYVALRGTDSVKEWISDGWAVPEPWPFSQDPAVHTHQGFTDIFQTLTLGEKPLLGALDGLKPLVTGHSLGGALAALLAPALGNGASCGVTFEAPRVGNGEFAAWSDRRVLTYRYVIIGDVVPHAPPENLGYYHAGLELDLDPAGVIPLTLDPETYLLSHHQLAYVQELLERA